MMDDLKLEQISKLASLQYSVEEVICIMELNSEEKADIYLDDSVAKKAYLMGQFQMEAEVRKSIFTLANAGSSPAQTMALKLIEGRKISNS